MNKQEKLALVALGVLADRLPFKPGAKLFWFSLGIGITLLITDVIPRLLGGLHV